jgi:hypothetical protein
VSAPLPRPRARAAPLLALLAAAALLILPFATFSRKGSTKRSVNTLLATPLGIDLVSQPIFQFLHGITVRH